MKSRRVCVREGFPERTEWENKGIWIKFILSPYKTLKKYESIMFFQIQNKNLKFGHVVSNISEDEVRKYMCV